MCYATSYDVEIVGIAQSMGRWDAGVINARTRSSWALQKVEPARRRVSCVSHVFWLVLLFYVQRDARVSV